MRPRSSAVRIPPGPARGAVPVLILGVALAGHAAPALGKETRESLAGREIGIENLVGNLEIVPGGGDAVVVHVRTRGRDGDRLEIDVSKSGDRSTLRILYPGDRVRAPEMSRGSRTTIWVDRDGSVSRRHGGSRKVTISGESGGIEAAADLRVEVPPGARLEATWGVGSAEVDGVDATLSLDGAAMSVVATGVKGRLEVDTGSGDIAVRGAEAALSIDTGSGQVELTDVRGGRIEVDTGSGSIRGNRVAAPEAEMDTGSGSIVLTRLEVERIHVDTGSGRIDLEIESDVRSLVVSTGSGGVRVVVPPTIDADVSIETGSGRIRCDLPLSSVSRERDELAGRIGRGGGEVRIETGSGSVELTGSR